MDHIENAPPDGLLRGEAERIGCGRAEIADRPVGQNDGEDVGGVFDQRTEKLGGGLHIRLRRRKHGIRRRFRRAFRFLVQGARLLRLRGVHMRPPDGLPHTASMDGVSFIPERLGAIL